MRHRRHGGEAFAREVADAHRMLRREVRALPALVLAVADGDGPGARRVGSWAWEVLDGLHHYRRAQGGLLPALRLRLLPGDAGAEAVTEAHACLAALDAPRQQAQGAAVRWQDGGAAGDGRACEASLRELGPPLDGALHQIERRLAPVVDATLTPAERTLVAQAVWAGARGRRRRELLAAVLEDATAPGAVLRGAPWHLRWFAPSLVVRPHQRRMAALRGGR